MQNLRLQKYLSQAGVASRRQAEQLILDGVVKVNAQIVRELGVKVDPEKDRIEVNGRSVFLKESKKNYLYYKPRGVLVTKRDPQGRKTVFDLLPFLHPSVNAVGRLDQDSEGLLILTNDGDLAHRLMHPSSEIFKKYWVQLNRLPVREAVDHLEEGIVLEEGKTAPAKIARLSSEEFKVQKSVSEEELFLPWISIQIHEGKKRQIRKMMEWAGCRVERLIRVAIGPVQLGSLSVGELKEVSSSLFLMK